MMGRTKRYSFQNPLIDSVGNGNQERKERDME
jgi:hypothetical protein